MIVYRQWKRVQHKRFSRSRYAFFSGWFLFGFIPLFIKQEAPWSEWR